jgi:xylulokinase
MTCMLGIDVGTSSVKAILMSLSGEILCRESEGYDIDIPQPGWAQQDFLMIWEKVRAVLQRLTSRTPSHYRIAAIGITGQMHGLIPLGKDNLPLCPGIIWADQRSTGELEEICCSGVQQRSGNPAAAGMFLASLLWLQKKRPEIYEKTKKLLLPKDYIRFRLCGSFITDPSDATGTLLYDYKKESWDGESMKTWGISPALLPSISASCQVVGTTHKQCSEETGLPEGIPVVAGGGDTPMQLLGNGVILPGQLSTNIGTASQINCITQGEPAADLRFNVFRHIPENRWIRAGAGLNGGIVLKWLKNTFFSSLDYKEMDRLAAKSPAGAKGLVLLPFLCGERSPYMDPDAKGILFGLQLSHTKEDMIRCAMESVAYSFRDCLEIFRQADISLKGPIIASGGGASSPLWAQIQADVLGMEVLVRDSQEQAARGAAIAAAVGCGEYHSLEEGCKAAVSSHGTIYEPNLKNHTVYQEGFSIYRSLYQNNQGLFHPNKT